MKNLKNKFAHKVFDNVSYEPFRMKSGKYGLIKYSNGEQIIIEQDEINVSEITYKLSQPNVPSSVLTLPNNVGSLKTAQELLAEARELLSMVVSYPTPEDEIFASLYTFASYTWDLHPYLNYYGCTGPAGSGKSTAMLAAGKLAYNTFFGSGADTDAVFIRIVDSNKATIAIDEGQKAVHNSTGDFHKILATGFGAPGIINKSAKGKDDNYVPQSFDVRGPKIISARYLSTDDAIASRTFETRMKRLSSSEVAHLVPISNPEWLDRAQQFKNDMTLYRQRRLLGEISEPGKSLADIDGLNITPRELQVFDWLFRENPCPDLEAPLLRCVKRQSNELKAVQGAQADVVILRTAYDLMLESDKPVTFATIQEHAQQFLGRQEIHPRTIGKIFRANHLSTKRCYYGYTLTSSAEDIASALQNLGLSIEELNEPNVTKNNFTGGTKW